MQRIYNILVGLFGESKQGSFDKYTTQYQFNCPNCAEENGGIDNKYNLEVSFSLGKYHCWSCGIAGRLSKLIKTYGGKSAHDDYIRIINEIKESKYYDLELFKDNCELFEEQFLKLPRTFEKINFDKCSDKYLIQYLNKRKITQDIIDFYNIGFTGWDGEDYPWRNRIIVPSYDYGGDLNYYVGRTYKPNDKRVKYRNCDFDKNNIILHEDKIKWDCDIYLVEGVFDCLYYYNTISMMGKSIINGSALYSNLFRKANANVVICLDGDTNIDETKRIYKMLNTGRLYGKIKYIRLGTDDLPWKDFGEIYEECGREGIIKAMASAKKFDEIELIK